MKKATVLLGGVVAGAARSKHTNLANTNENNNHHPESDAISSRPRISNSTLRLLQQKDNNAMMRVPPNKPPVGKSGNANMPPYEKHHGTTRPLMPTLSAAAAAAKNTNKTPLTPRVAGSTPQSATTPLSRRGPRPDASQRDEVTTPISSFLSNNITPRSGSRRSRVDSTNTTPTGTPTGTPVPLLAHETPRAGGQEGQMYGLGTNGADRDIPKRQNVSFTQDVGTARPSADAKFFFASDAKTVQPPPRPALVPKTSSSTFLYANGESIPPPPQRSSNSSMGSQVGEDTAAPKFFHANGTPDLQSATCPHLPPPRPSSVVSSSSRMASPRLGAATPTGTLSPPQRPSSPAKLNQYASLSAIRNTPPLPAPVLPRPQPAGRGVASSGLVSARRASIEAQKVIHHGRSSSGSSTAGPPIRKVSGGVTFDTATVPSSPLILPTTLPVSTPEESPDASVQEDIVSELHSPIKAGHSLEKMNELAAEARRERKVLDLEITNSSLEAINRTLEREMRKVTAELRRYRRLSRSGRLSIASSTMRAPSETLSIDDASGMMLSDMSEGDEDEEEGEEEESDMSEDDSPDEASLSPDAMAEHDLKHRKRDERRLQLDLTKHQQLLIDSQKMNQSLKRCLGWSESMINEGKKALEYRVRVTDIELGGRVLAPDEIEERELEAERDNEGMSDIGARLLREAREKAAAVKVVTWGGEGSDDRDSGIELRDSGQSFGSEE